MTLRNKWFGISFMCVLVSCFVVGGPSVGLGNACGGLESLKYRISGNWSFGSSVRLGNCCVCWSSW